MPDTYPHITATPGVAGGRPRVAGRRIRVADVVVWHERLRMTVDEIAASYDLSLSEVHAALAYYFDHREEVDRSLEQAGALAEVVAAAQPSVLAQKLKQIGRAA